MTTPSEFSPTVERFSGFADVYNAYRPIPPDALVDVLTQLTQLERPRLVVDLGCGTGLSTRIWAEKADRVIGIDPSHDMRREAETRTEAKNVEYRAGYGHETGLPDQCADIATCSSSIHWMEPVSTFAEIGRILRKGGMFAAYGYDWPPTLGAWEIERHHQEFQQKCVELEEQYGVSKDVKQWPKNRTPDGMRESGEFRHVKLIHLHQILPWNADSFIGWILSQGSVESLLKAGISESEMGLDKLRTSAKHFLGDKSKPCYFSYWVAVGIA